MCDFCLKAKTCPKHRAQLSCRSKFASKHSAQLSFYLNLATFFKRLELLLNNLRNRPVAWLASKHSTKLSSFLNLGNFYKRLKLVQKTLRNCPVAWNWRQNTLRNFRFAWALRLLITIKNLSKRPCGTVLLLEIGIKTLCANVVFFEFGEFL